MKLLKRVATEKSSVVRVHVEYAGQLIIQYCVFVCRSESTNATRSLALLLHVWINSLKNGWSTAPRAVFWFYEYAMGRRQHYVVHHLLRTVGVCWLWNVCVVCALCTDEREREKFVMDDEVVEGNMCCSTRRNDELSWRHKSNAVDKHCRLPTFWFRQWWLLAIFRLHKTFNTFDRLRRSWPSFEY